MTREEAIKYLIGMDIETLPDGLDEAIRMAIEALKREEAEAKGYCHRIKPKPDYTYEAEMVKRLRAYHYNSYPQSDDTTEAQNDAIEKQNDAIDIVRCKDCKYKYVSGNGTTQYYVCDFMDAQYEDDGFCHHGESEGEE